MPKATPPDNASYEERYRAVYAAGVPFAKREAPADHYRDFLARQPARGRLIDFGCGEGFPAAMAADLGYEVLAIDSAPSAIARARQAHHHRNLMFLVADVCELDDIPSESFDIAVDLGCLHVLVDETDAQRYLAHAFRLLRPGGLAYYQNLVPADDAEAWFPRERQLLDWWRARAAERHTRDLITETYEVNGRSIELERPHIPSAFRDLRTQVSLLSAAGFDVQQARVVMRGVNSPFEAILIAGKPPQDSEPGGPGASSP